MFEVLVLVLVFFFFVRGGEGRPAGGRREIWVERWVVGALCEHRVVHPLAAPAQCGYLVN
jgi:hypothetical protein